MIHPMLSNGRVLFLRNGCNYCSKWENFIFKLNSKLMHEKRIKIIYCTFADRYGAYENKLIEIFAKHFNSYPTLFIDGEKIEGANSVLECEAWITTRLRDDFIFPQLPGYLSEIGKYSEFNAQCRFSKGRIVCNEN